MKYVVIGNGVAGINACLEIRNRDEDSDITVVSKETPYFFSRTALMYIGMGDMRLQDTEPFERGEYKKLGIDLIQEKAERIDTGGKKVTLADDSELAYDKLLLATGAVPATYGWPGLDLDGVCYLISFQHVQTLIEKLQYAKRGVIVGGGLVGIELAEVFVSRGIQVDYFMKDTHFWKPTLVEEEGRWVENIMESHGVTLHRETQLAEINGVNGRVTGVATDRGDTIPCDVVGIATGVQPDTDLASNSGIPCGRGVLTNSRLETHTSSVYAAGDCAEIESDGSTENFVKAVWYLSRDMGRTAGANMAGDTREYVPGYWYNSAKFFDREYTCAGKTGPLDEGEKAFYYQDKRHSARIIHDGEKKVLGFSFIGSRWDHNMLISFIREKRTLSFFLDHYREALFETELTPLFSLGAGSV